MCVPALPCSLAPLLNNNYQLPPMQAVHGLLVWLAHDLLGDGRCVVHKAPDTHEATERVWGTCTIVPEPVWQHQGSCLLMPPHLLMPPCILESNLLLASLDMTTHPPAPTKCNACAPTSMDARHRRMCTSTLWRFAYTRLEPSLSEISTRGSWCLRCMCVCAPRRVCLLPSRVHVYQYIRRVAWVQWSECDLSCAWQASSSYANR